jgi:hypothetical protein
MTSISMYRSTTRMIVKDVRRDWSEDDFEAIAPEMFKFHVRQCTCACMTLLYVNITASMTL